MIPYIKGVVTPQAHVGIPDGTTEEEFARNGFSGRYAHLYRSEPPVNWTAIEGPLKPRSYDFNRLKLTNRSSASSWMKNRVSYLQNDDVRILFASQLPAAANAQSAFFRNADADELFFVHNGTGRLETDFGPLTYESGDYILIPRGTVYRVQPKIPTDLMIIESFSEIRLPDKGMLGQHALFDPAMLKCPDPIVAPAPKGEYKLEIKRCDQITTVTYPFCPINTVGWKGTLTVWQLNVRDIRPILSDRYHLPPSAHSTFVGNQFVVCTFLPRPLENGDPKALKVPFYHSNIDFDEVLFYHRGQFFSRTGIQEGMLTFHPQGIHHGPQTGAVGRTTEARETNEIAIMIDTKRPLFPTEAAAAIENPDYWKSWMPTNGGKNEE